MSVVSRDAFFQTKKAPAAKLKEHQGFLFEKSVSQKWIFPPKVLSKTSHQGFKTDNQQIKPINKQIISIDNQFKFIKLQLKFIKTHIKSINHIYHN